MTRHGLWGQINKFKSVHCFQLDKWWSDYGYMDFRLPLPMMNMAGPGPFIHNCWPAQDGTQVERAALAVHYMIKYWHIIRRLDIMADFDSFKIVTLVDHPGQSKFMDSYQLNQPH